MSKPTLVQTILNRPSQTYASGPGPPTPKTDYYSNRQELLRMATLEAQHQLNTRTSPVQQHQQRRQSPQPVVHSPTPIVAPRSSAMSSAPAKSRASSSASSTPTHTPSRSSTTPSRPSPVPTPPASTPRPSSRPPSASSTSTRTPVTNRPTPQAPPVTRVQRLSHSDRVELETDSEGDQSAMDNFFTPPTSPRGSMASSVATITFPTGSTSRKPSRKSLRSATSDGNRLSGGALPAGDTRPSSTSSNRSPVLPPGLPSVAVPSTRTPSSSSDRNRALHTLSASSLSSTSLDAHSYISDWLAYGESTTSGTTPHQSDNSQDGHKRRTSASASAAPPKTKPSSSSSSSKPKPSSSSTPTNTNGTHRSSSQKATETVRSTTTSTNAAFATPVSSGSKSRRAEATKDPKSSSSSSTDPHSRVASGSSGDATSTRPNGPPASDSRTNKATITPIVPTTTTTPTPPVNTSSMKSDPRPSNGYTTSTKTPVSGSGVAIPPPHIPSRNHTFSAFAPLATSSPRSSVVPGTASPKAPQQPQPSTIVNPAPNTKSAPPSTSMSTSSSKNNRGPNNTISSENKLPSAVPQAPPKPNNSPPSSVSPPPSSSTTPVPPSSSYVTQHRKKPPPKPPSSFMVMMANNNMDAVMEEDEDAPFTPRMQDKDAPWADGHGPQRTLRHTSGSKSKTKMSPGSGSGSGGNTPTHGGSAERMRRRRSRSLDSFDSRADSSFSSSGMPVAREGGGVGSGGSGSGSASTIRRGPQTLSAEVQAIPHSRPGEIPSKGTQGYSSLVLARAPPPVTASGSGRAGSKGSGLKEGWSKWLSSVMTSSDGKVDLTRSGLAQTTMASVEVVRGLGAVVAAKKTPLVGAALGSVLNGVRRRASSGPAASTAHKAPASTNPKSAQAMLANSNQVGVEDSILGFTSHRKPPTYVPSGSVLVQVWAVGVDEVDGRLVGVRFGPSETAATGPITDAQQVDEPDEMVYHSHPGPTAAGDGTTKGGKKGGLAGLGRTLSLRAKMAAAATLARSGSVTPTMGTERNRKGSFGGKTKDGPQRSASVSMRGTTISGPQPQQRRPPSFSAKKGDVALQSASSTPTKTPTRSSTIATVVPTPPLKRNTSVSKPVKHTYAEVGYIPGRSFVGRVLECGWEVKDEVVRKGEWVVGLLDVRKAGALAEFIVVDRHRIHRVPNPRPATTPSSSTSTPNGSQIYQGPSTSRMPAPVWTTSPNATQGGAIPPTLTLEELALLPLCGLPAYRAMRTFQVALTASAPDPTPASPGPLSPSGAARAAQSYVTNNGYPTDDPSHYHNGRRRRRALVLRGHDGVGAMAVQMLVQKGWRVSVHVPLSALPNDATYDQEEAYKASAEDRARIWGADEVIFDDGEQDQGSDDDPATGTGSGSGNALATSEINAVAGGGGTGAAVRVLDSLREEGDVFDAILDTIGGKEVREASERLLKNNLVMAAMNAESGGEGGLGRSISFRSKKKSGSSQFCGQFTTLVGDVPERTIPSAADNFKAGIRALRLGGTATEGGGSDGALHRSPSKRGSEDEGNAPNKAGGKIGYAWISVAQDIDWEGVDVGETLGTVLRMALEEGVRPWIGEGEGQAWSKPRVVAFEKAPQAFVDGGPLGNGGTVVVKIAA